MTTKNINRFSEDLTPPDINGKYECEEMRFSDYSDWHSENTTSTGWTLFHKLLFFPRLLKDNIELVKHDINTPLKMLSQNCFKGSFELIFDYFFYIFDDIELFELLLKNGLKIDEKYLIFHKFNIQQIDLLSNYYDVNELLLNYNVISVYDNYQTPNIEVVKLLINKGADINYSNNNNTILTTVSRCLSHATHCALKKYIIELINLGAKIQINDDCDEIIYRFLINLRFEQLENKINELSQKII